MLRPCMVVANDCGRKELVLNCTTLSTSLGNFAIVYLIRIKQFPLELSLTPSLFVG